MDIISASIYNIAIPFLFPIGHQLKNRQKSKSLVIMLETEKGLHGFGEAAPRGYVNGENTKDTLEQFQDIEFPTVCSINDVQFFTASLFKKGLSSSLICAVEMALLDLLGKSNSQSLATYFETQTASPIHYSVVLPFLSKKSLEQWLPRIKAMMPLNIKLKVGRNNDFELLDMIRTELGTETKIRLDANQAWMFDEAIRKINVLSRFNIESIEEPLKNNSKQRLVDLPRYVDCPIMLDESLCSLADAKFFTQNIPSEKLQFNLKISKMGGLLEMERIYQYAQTEDIECQLGCNVGETAILSAAGRLFAQWHPLKNLEGSLGPFFMEEDVANEKLIFGKKGKASFINSPGLGITVSISQLKKYSQQIIQHQKYSLIK